MGVWVHHRKVLEIETDHIEDTGTFLALIIMTLDNKDVALSVIHFLKQAVASKQVSEDYSESMDVAIDCIADAFEVNKDDDAKVVSEKLQGKTLLDILNGKPVAATEEKLDLASSAPVVDAETKTKADAAKVEGNRAMSARNFDEAIAKYTEAINLDGSNVVYYSNRAAAYSSASQHDKAVADAEKAIAMDATFSKAYSRLGLAKYALGDAKGAMESYKKGLDVEGDNKSEAMKKGYETAKRRVEEELEKSMGGNDSVASREAELSSASGAGAGAGAGGMPDFSSMFGGQGGGMPSLSDMLSNPQMMQAAQEMMSNPQALQGLMSNPAVRNMAQNMGIDPSNMPDISSIMNNPMLQNMFGGQGNRDGQGSE